MAGAAKKMRRDFSVANSLDSSTIKGKVARRKYFLLAVKTIVDQFKFTEVFYEYYREPSHTTRKHSADL
jgi:hypothetical protein